MVRGRIPLGRPINVVPPPPDFALTSEDDNDNDVDDVVRTTPAAPVLPVGSLPVLLFELALDPGPPPFEREREGP
jgi:hypothetical protein